MTFPNKMTSRDAAAKRYGHIDLASGYWPNKNQWIELFHVPENWFPNWHVLDTNQTVKVIACNKDTHAPLLKALTAVHECGLGSVLKTFDGCFNIRKVRGSNLMSTHAYGLGFDFNASINPLGGQNGDFAKHLDVVECFKAQGFSWGGDWHGRKDQMHFSYAWE